MDHGKYMEAQFEDEWRECVAAGRCWIVQDKVFNPYDGQGLDLCCLVHDHTFNVPVDAAQFIVQWPVVCPAGAKAKLN